MILLDTHVLIWAVNADPRLGDKASETIEETARDDGVLVSAITPWEVALLAEKGRLQLGREIEIWLAAALALPGLRVAPIEPELAVDSVRLPGNFHADPADRLIIATARYLRIPLVTADRAILEYAGDGHVQTLDASI